MNRARDCARQSPQAVDQRILDDELWNLHAIDPVRHDHRDRAGSLGLVGEFPAVAGTGKTRNEAAARRAAQRHEQASGFHQPAILRDEVDRRICEIRRQRTKRAGYFGNRPQRHRAHATLRCERGRHRLVIAEMQNLVADDLSDLVALAGDQQRIAWLQRRDAGLDRLGAIGDVGRAFRLGQDRGSDRCPDFRCVDCRR